MQHYTAFMKTPEFLEAMKIYGLKQEDISIVMQNIGAMRPIDNALQYFTTNVLMRREPRNRKFYHNRKQ